MRTSPFPTASLTVALSLTLALAPSALAPSALGHGSMASPLSRVYGAFLEGPENPQSAAVQAAIAVGGKQPLYDWNELVNFFPGSPAYQTNVPYHDLIPSGKIASANNPKYAGFDLVRDDWPTTPISAGPRTLQWFVTTPHDPSVFHAWITTSNWDPSQPLSWETLEKLPLGPVTFEGSTYRFDTLIPARSGKHVIHVIWQRLDPVGESFHAVCDVDFGPGTVACAEDFDGDGKVDGADLATVLAGWGTAAADLTGDGSTDGADLALVLAAWGTCLPDCDGDGISDADEIASGATDCNGDGVPDACQDFQDCDGDGVWDACAILNGLAADCNMNLIPDSCEIAAGGDGNGNGFLDACEIEGLTYLWQVQGSWDTGFQASITLTNGSTEMLHHWEAHFDAPTYVISSLWNGEIAEQSGGMVMVHNAFWNGHLHPGDSVTFGFIGQGVPTPPSWLEVNGSPANPGG